jgi:hypothetical protein
MAESKTDNGFIRTWLSAFLTGEHAHMTLEEAVKDFPLDKINLQAPNSTYTPWRLLEHIRITQQDILEYMKNPKYKEISWPKEYWPEEGVHATPEQWKKSITQFTRDLHEIISLLQSPGTDLAAMTPQKDGQSVLREILLIIDHNAYHIGEFAILRDVMGTWKK